MMVKFILGTVITVSALAIGVTDKQAEITKSPTTNSIETIEFQQRSGNVVSTEAYIVRLENGSEFRYTMSKPGPGMLCNADDSKEDCRIQKEAGYAELDSALSEYDVDRRDTTRLSAGLRIKGDLCAKNISATDIQILEC